MSIFGVVEALVASQVDPEAAGVVQEDPCSVLLYHSEFSTSNCCCSKLATAGIFGIQQFKSELLLLEECVSRFACCPWLVDFKS